jgi:hypothetical protein
MPSDRSRPAEKLVPEPGMKRMGAHDGIAGDAEPARQADACFEGTNNATTQSAPLAKGELRSVVFEQRARGLGRLAKAFV